MSYGGYRNVDHDIEPTIEELKEDMRLLNAMGVKIDVLTERQREYLSSWTEGT